MSQQDEDDRGSSHASEDSGGSSGRARPAPRRPTIHDEPTIVEDAPTAPPPQARTTQGGHAFPGGLDRLAERYALEEPIAAGGAAMVWRAFDEVLSRTVAIKLLHPHLAGDPGTVERFRQESINAARLTHPNVVAIHDTGQEGDVVYLVMEHVEGPTLREVIARRGALEPDQVAAIGAQVAAALGDAHAHGLVHRDVKPANILIGADGVAKVADFGIAKALTAAESVITSPGLLVGTAAYVAPEQLTDGHAVDPRADVYSLGVVLHEALTGSRAFQGDTATATAAARLARQLAPPRSLRPGVPRVLDEVVVRATRLDPGARFADGTAVAEALLPLVSLQPSDVTEGLMRAYDQGNGGTTTAPPVTYADRRRRRRRERTPVAQTIAAFVLGIIVALGGVSFARQSDGPAPDAAPGTAVAGAAVFDPYDEAGPTPGDPAALVDGDTGTTWRTGATTGGLAGTVPGVGVWFDLGEEVAVAGLEMTMVTPGVGGEVLVRSTAPGPDDTELDWESVASFDGGGRRVVVPVEARARWWLVWLTELPEEEGVGLAELAEVRFVDEP